MIGWVDIETTGLDPEVHTLLEVGLVITDDDLTVVRSRSVVISIWPIETFKWDTDAPLETWHRDNGLLAEVPSGLPPAEAQQRLVELFDGLPVMPMGGAGPHFDRAWLKVWMPGLERQFHYRNFDVSGVREMARRWRPDLTEREPVARKTHRAMPDLEDALGLAAFYRKELFEKHKAPELPELVALTLQGFEKLSEPVPEGSSTPTPKSMKPPLPVWFDRAVQHYGEDRVRDMLSMLADLQIEVAGGP